MAKRLRFSERIPIVYGRENVEIKLKKRYKPKTPPFKVVVSNKKEINLNKEYFVLVIYEIP